MTPVTGALLNTGMIETNYKNETAWVDEILDMYGTQVLHNDLFLRGCDNATGSNPQLQSTMFQ